MKRSLVFLFVLLGIVLSACASKPAATASAAPAAVADALPAIEPYEDEAVALMPEPFPVVDEVAP